MRAGGGGPPEVPANPEASPSVDSSREDSHAKQQLGDIDSILSSEAVRPAEFEDEEDAPVAATSTKVAGTAGKEDDLLAAEEEDEILELQDIGKKVEQAAGQTKDAIEEKAVKAKDVVVDKAREAAKTVATEAEKPKDPVVENAAAAEPEKVKGKAQQSEQVNGTGVKMTPEQIEKAKAAREAAVKAAEEKVAKQKANTKKILATAEDLLVKVGTKTRSFEIGKGARAKAEVFVEDTIKLGASEKATQSDKVKASAAGAAKSVVATIAKGWQEKLVPLLKEKLPDEYSGISNKAFASAAVGLFVAVVLFPSLFSGGGQPEKEKPKKKLDADTAVLEQKLKRDRNLPSSYSTSRSAAQRGMFPPEESTAPPPKAPEAPKAVTPPPKAPEIKKSETIADTTKAAAPTTPSATPPKTVETSPPPLKAQPQPEPMKPADVTPAIVMSSVTKALGTNANLVASISFDSLSPEPTVVLEVSKAFHRLPAAEQRTIADKTLKATRMLGYERVSFVEKDTGMEVAHAGVDIDLEDETENLRASLNAVQKQNDKLAAANANQEAQIDTLKTRLDDERDELAARRLELEAVINNIKQENAGLIQDLADAKEEIAKIPDRLALEERTLEAETKSRKMADTVEMLSKQLTIARDDEARAKQVESDSVAAVKEADRVKTEALASVTGQIEQAKADANRKATQDIGEARNDAQNAVESANKRVHEIETSMAAAQAEARRILEDTTRSYEQRLAEEQKSKASEVKTIQDKYEAMLEDVQRKAKAELDAFQKDADRQMAVAMKEAKANASALMKERDQAAKETEKSETRAEKAALKAARERDNLQARIAKLEAKLKGKEVSQGEATGEVQQAGVAAAGGSGN